MKLTFRCPECKVRLAPREFAWTHRHPHRRLRQIGAAMMVAGFLEAAIGLGGVVHG